MAVKPSARAQPGDFKCNSWVDVSTPIPNSDAMVEPQQLVELTPVFESALPYSAERIRAAAIYCSDGRFGEQCDDFLQTSLKLPRYDRLVIPGGPACLAGYLMTHREGEALLNQLRFLVDVHGLTRLVLIGHGDCAFYTERLHVARETLREHQFIDLAKAARLVRQHMSMLSLEAYFALRIKDHIAFAPVSIDEQSIPAVGPPWF